MRNKIVAGNWKMNLNYAQAMALVDSVIQQTDDSFRTQIIFAPPFPFLAQVSLLTQLRTNIFIAAQNCSSQKAGAYTGEVSASMIQSIGIESVIIGHSERRAYFNETDEELAEKVRRALENNLQPIFCCGETKEQRDNANQFEVIRTQLNKGLFHLSKKQVTDAIIAYEPVWAIGTGVNAIPAQAEEMHLFIRNLIKEKYDAEAANALSILYGGSINSKNASSLFSCANVDGGLVGGASLKVDEFVAIIKAMEECFLYFTKN